MGVESPQGMPCNHAPFGAVDHGGVRLGCGFRQPNSETEFGASVMVTPPYGCNTGSAKQRADVGIGPYALRGTARRGRRALRVVAESRRDCPGQRRTAERLRRGREGWVGIGAEIIPKVSSNAGQSLSQPAADSSLCTREPFPAGDGGIGRGMRIAASLRSSQ